ncbi:tyrosine-type recombinase/integrase [Paenibacillus ehimensis]|uniref:tyrosine-type recombinase/integrase n=1 Tax=Paenibacillus ehimensis TaxID=79264 RepID=UPI0004721ECD|nr:site-specific integrase [Paenibacillus ehimensis]MEC0211806.1 site-specific integrase [Paenibacillus ehimensis]
MPIYSYEKGGKEHWYYAFEVKDKKGKRKTIKKRGFTGKTEARAAERQARVEWEKGQYVDPTKMTYGEFLNNWFENKNDISEQTRHTNEGQIKNHILPELGHIPLQKVDVEDIEAFIKTLQKKELSSGTVKKIFNLVQTSFRAALRKEYIAKNPFDLLDKGSKPRVEKVKIDYWTKEEVKQFLGSFDHRLKIVFILAIYTGMRRGEILGLRWKDINFETSQIGIRQILGFRRKMKDGAKTTAGDRSISISPFVLSELKKHKLVIEREKRWRKDKKDKEYNDNDLVVCQLNGNSLSWTNFDKYWKRCLEKSGVRPIRFHDLRHTCASLLLSAGVHPKVVQELLGHSSIKVTLDLYSHMMPNMQADAVKALDQMLN